jgi:hypothetical protein
LRTAGSVTNATAVAPTSTTTLNSATVTVSSATGIAVGMPVTGTGIRPVATGDAESCGHRDFVSAGWENHAWEWWVDYEWIGGGHHDESDVEHVGRVGVVHAEHG